MTNLLSPETGRKINRRDFLKLSGLSGSVLTMLRLPDGILPLPPETAVMQIRDQVNPESFTLFNTATAGIFDLGFTVRKNTSEDDKPHIQFTLPGLSIVGATKLMAIYGGTSLHNVPKSTWEHFKELGRLVQHTAQGAAAGAVAAFLIDKYPGTGAELGAIASLLVQGDAPSCGTLIARALDPDTATSEAETKIPEMTQAVAATVTALEEGRQPEGAITPNYDATPTPDGGIILNPVNTPDSHYAPTIEVTETAVPTPEPSLDISNIDIETYKKSLTQSENPPPLATFLKIGGVNTSIDDPEREGELSMVDENHWVVKRKILQKEYIFYEFTRDESGNWSGTEPLEGHYLRMAKAAQVVASINPHVYDEQVDFTEFVPVTDKAKARFWKAKYMDTFMHDIYDDKNQKVGSVELLAFARQANKPIYLLGGGHVYGIAIVVGFSSNLAFTVTGMFNQSQSYNIFGGITSPPDIQSGINQGSLNPHRVNPAGAELVYFLNTHRGYGTQYYGIFNRMVFQWHLVAANYGWLENPHTELNHQQGSTPDFIISVDGITDN